MARYPGATWRPLPSTSYNAGARTARLGLILHVQQGNASPFGWFANPVSKASSTFWVSKAGLVEQYMEAGSDASWAQAAGNFAYDSVETEGLDSEPLTGAQITALAALCAWEHATFGMPLVTIETPGASGFGWHGMGGVAWGNHPGCPGDLRKAQRAQILGVVPVSNTTTMGGAIPTAPGALTATTPQEADVTIDELVSVLRSEGVSGAGDLSRWDAPMRTIVNQETTKVLRSEGVSGAADVSRLVAALVPAIVAALPAGQVLTEADVETAVRNVFHGA